MPRVRTAQQDALITTLFDNEWERSCYKTNFQEGLPQLATAKLITDTAPTLAQMALLNLLHPKVEVKAGNSSTNALCTYNTAGGITLTTAGADDDQEMIGFNVVASQSAGNIWDWATQDEIAFRTRVKLGTTAQIADAIHFAGMFLTIADPFAEGTDADAVFFDYLSGTSANWRACFNIAGTDVAIDTGVVAAAATTFDLALRVDSDRVPHFYIDNVLVAQGTALTTAIDLLPFIGVETTASAAKVLHVRGFAVSKAEND